MTSATTPTSGAKSSVSCGREAASAATVLADRVNARLDAAVGMNVRVRGRLVGSWRAFSLAALGVATGVWVLRGLQEDVPVTALALVPFVPATILSLHRRWIIRSQRPARLVFHRHVAASAAVAIPLLALLGALTWRALDAATTAVLFGLAVGRIGCLRSGCCSGRPAVIGARYPWLGAEERHLPIQLLDAGICVALAIATIVCHTAEARPGVAAAVGASGYLAIRAALDELRDERVRSRRHTEAQRVAVAAGIAAAAWAVASAIL